MPIWHACEIWNWRVSAELVSDGACRMNAALQIQELLKGLHPFYVQG